MNFLDLISLLGWILLGVCILEMLLGYIFCNQMLGKKPYTYESGVERELKKGNVSMEFLEEFTQEEFEIKSQNGYRLYGRYFLQGSGERRTAVIMHGHAGNLMWSYKYARIFQDMGYNWFIFDNRGCGKSGGKKYTMGYREAQDLKNVVDFARGIVQDAKIILHGESLGASTSILMLEKDRDIACIIADCGFSSLKEEVKHHLHIHKLPWYFVGIFGSLLCMLKFGFVFSNVSPIDVLLKRIPEVPIMFIHGGRDAKTPVWMAEKMFYAHCGERDLVIHPDAGHARTYSADKEQYKLRVEEFCEKYVGK